MYVNSEKELEDYICENLGGFIEFLKDTYEEKRDIEFVGRQITIGESRLDLLFQIEEESKNPYGGIAKTYIVVELKFRKAEPKDISQLSRYMNLLYNLEFDSRIGGAEVFVKGMLLTTGLNEDMQEVQMYLNDYMDSNITFAHIKTHIDYRVDSYSIREGYIESMSVDSRLSKTKEDKKNGEEAND